jgi:hypothetical protein
MPAHRSARDVLAGATFVVFGVAFAFGATSYAIGDPVRMGPGYFPLIVGIMLSIVGIVIALKPFPEDDAGPISGPPWRALVLIVGAFVVFGLTVRGLGLAPSTFVAVAMASFSTPQMRLPTALALSFALTVISVLVFAYGLSLRLPLWGPWIPF